MYVNSTPTDLSFRGEIEDAYLKDWISDSSTWDSMSVYKAAADLLPIQRGHTHVDFGTGLAHLPEALLNKEPNARILATERGQNMFRAACDRLSERNTPFSYHNVVATTTRNTGVTIDCEDSEQLDWLRAQRNGIVLLRDDMRANSILSGVLGDSQIDSASHTFPGTSLEVAFSDGLVTAEQLSTGDSELIRGLHQKTDDIYQCARGSMLEILNNIMKPRGIYLEVDRTDIPHGYLQPNFPSNQLRQALSDHSLSSRFNIAECWTAVDAGILLEDVESIQQVDQFLDGERAEAHPNFTNCITYVAWERNDSPASK